MHVILANPRGFCAGVNMAISSLETALTVFDAPIYVYHEIVHNRPVVESFRNRGVIFVDTIQEIPANSTVLYSAHGVAPEIRQLSKERNLRAIDATCPLVTKVHTEAIRFAKEGYTIILIGHEGHDEVIGTMGEAPHAMVLVEGPDEVGRLNFPPETKLAYLTQTTLSVDEAMQTINALIKRFPGIVGPAKADICYATQNRQEAVRELSAETGVVLILGSQNSSNSLRLRELAISHGKRAYLFDSVEELDLAWFRDNDTVLVTAGASAPEEKVQQVIEWLKTTFSATVEEKSIREEHVSFPLPKELRVLSSR